MTLRIGSLCSGYEGLGMAVQSVLGGELAWVADNDKGAAKILAHRYPDVPNLGDITVVDWSGVKSVDIACMGFPCTDVSCAGARAGLREGTRSGVWSHCARAVGVLHPSLVVIENVRGLHSAGADSQMELCPWCLGDAGAEHALRASGAVLGDLADLGYDAEWVTVSASDAGAPHRRERVFILAWPAVDPEGVGRGLGGGRERQGGAGEQCGLGAEERGPRPAADSERDARAEDEPDRPAAARDRPSPENPDRAACGERGKPASGQAESGRARADAGGPGGAPAADARREHEHGRPGGEGPVVAETVRVEEVRDADGCGAPPPADAGGARLGELAGEPPAQEARTNPSDLAGDHHGARPAVQWGPYEPAIRRWESALGRPAPRPTEPGRTGERLSPRFVEWMQGLPEGWVTGVPGLSRNDQLKALGNGVVPQQCALALRILLGPEISEAAA